jgi:hypothetical protein
VIAPKTATFDPISGIGPRCPFTFTRWGFGCDDVSYSWVILKNSDRIACMLDVLPVYILVQYGSLATTVLLT